MVMEVEIAFLNPPPPPFFKGGDRGNSADPLGKRQMAGNKGIKRGRCFAGFPIRKRRYFGNFMIWWRQRDSNPSSFVEIIQEIAKNYGE